MEELVELLEELRSWVVSSNDDDFVWSSWTDVRHATGELDELIAATEAGEDRRADISLVFAPTGNGQELSVQAGWGDEFLELAARVDAALDRHQ